MIDLEAKLVAAEVIRHEYFITAGGQPAEVKVELDCLDPRSESFSQDLFAVTVGNLAVKAAQLQPDFLVSAPHGADGLTAALSEELEIPFVIPEKLHGSKELAAPKGRHPHNLTDQCERGVIIDDVLTSGSTMKRINALALFNRKIIAGLVVWDRFPHINRSLPFPTYALIERHVPLTRKEK